MATHSKIDQLQLLQQNMQNILLQKQQQESVLIELNSACEELGKTDKAYKIVGKIMIASPPQNLLLDLQQKKEIAELRLKNLLKQEENIKRSIESVQEEAVKELQQKK